MANPGSVVVVVRMRTPRTVGGFDNGPCPLGAGAWTMATGAGLCSCALSDGWSSRPQLTSLRTPKSKAFNVALDLKPIEDPRLDEEEAT